MTSPLYLVRLSVDARKLYAFARRSRATGHDFDEGYAVHALLAALFDHGASPETRVAPKPFRIHESTPRTVDVLGYASFDHLALAERARTFADPLAWGVCDIDAMVSKPMPSVFDIGLRLGFSARACPVRRIARCGPMTRDRAEVDAFLAKSWEVGLDVSLKRADVYCAWLRDELGKEGAADLLSASIANYRLGHLRRRTHGEDRKTHRTERPDVTFDGVLQVRDTAAFARRLARGVGRHRAFGFGMLLLKPVADVADRTRHA
jgi:CRISPR system Cascade subunit CasE